MEVHFRALTADDQDQLWHWLHLSLWDPPPAGLRPIETLQLARVRIYAEAWGRPSDIGVVAVVDERNVGACWLRLLPAGIGLASLDGSTPQLGIALEPGYRGRGIGRAVMRAAIAEACAMGYTRVALTVHPDNPARALYESLGFQEVERRNGYLLMVT